MSAIRALTTAAIVLSCLLGARGARAADELPAGTQEIDVDAGGHRRFFLMHVPPQAAAGRPLPAVLSFHGGGGEPRAQEQWTALDALGDREGFIVIYPAGYSRTGDPGRTLLTWNAGTCCGPAMDDGSDDVGFVRQVLSAANARAPLDVTRIYATGMSNGAMMSYRLARELSPQIAAIAPVSGASDAPIPAGALPTPVLHIHSVDDPRAPYAGGQGPPFPFTDRRVNHPSVEKVVGEWAAHDGCPPAPAAEAPRTNAAGHTATRLTYGPCASGKPVVLWRLTGSGHVWPGAPQKHATKLLGTATDVIDANAESWAFFRQFQRPNAPTLPVAPATVALAAPPASGLALVSAARPELELPFSRTVLVLRAAGARDRFRADDGVMRAGALSLQARTTLVGRVRLDQQGLHASALMVGLDGRAFTTDLPTVAADDKFYRLGASLGGFLLTPGRHFYWAQVGTFVAEQGRLFDDPKLRVYGLGLGTAPVGERTQFIYGLGYVYDFGRGLPLPFLGVDWRCSPNVRLNVLLPLLARLTWRTSDVFAVTFGTHVAGDIYRYQGADAMTGAAQIRQLRIARLRAGVGARYAVAARARLEFELGIEGAQIQDDVTTRSAGGGYLLGSLVLGKGNDGREEYLSAD